MHTCNRPYAVQPDLLHTGMRLHFRRCKHSTFHPGMLHTVQVCACVGGMGESESEFNSPMACGGKLSCSLVVLLRNLFPRAAPPSQSTMGVCGVPDDVLSSGPAVFLCHILDGRKCRAYDPLRCPHHSLQSETLQAPDQTEVQLDRVCSLCCL